MQRSLVILAKLLLVIAVFYVIADAAIAGLIGRSGSHVKLLKDGRHMLVFLEPAQYAAAGEDTCTLPDTHTVNLREAYPASGCYEVGSFIPLWTAPWQDYEIWIVSDDLRFLVRCNLDAEGDYVAAVGGKTNWALKFYDRGREINSYDLNELVDCPSFMPSSSASEFRYSWIDDYDRKIANGNLFFSFRTTTRDAYRFDLASGKIVEQYHVWGRFVIAASLIVASIVILVVGLFVPGFRHALGAPRNDCRMERDITARSKVPSKRTGSFSLRTLLLVTTAIALLCGSIPRWPHVAVLVSSLIVALFLTRASIRHWRSDAAIDGRVQRRIKFGGLVVMAGICWLAFYILTAAPVLAVVDWFNAPDDVRMAVIMTVYRPLIWINALVTYGFVPHGWYELFPGRWYQRAW